MTAEIKKLFQSNVELLDIVDKAVLLFREQDYNGALELMPEVSEKMRHVIDGIISDKEYFELVSTDSLMEMLEGIVEASRAEDYVLLADLLELQLCTLICNVQELIMKKEDCVFFSESMYQEQCAAMVEKLKAGGTNCPEALFEKPLNPEELLEQGYRVEVTSCGLMTVAMGTDRGSVYLHSNHKVGLEAFFTARSFAKQDADTYLMYAYYTDLATYLTTYGEEVAKQHLVFMAIAEQENLRITDAQYDEILQEQATEAGYESVDEYLAGADKALQKRYYVLDEVLAFVTENAMLVEQ